MSYFCTCIHEEYFILTNQMSNKHHQRHKSTDITSESTFSKKERRRSLELSSPFLNPKKGAETARVLGQIEEKNEGEEEVIESPQQKEKKLRKKKKLKIALNLSLFKEKNDHEKTQTRKNRNTFSNRITFFGSF